MLTQHCCYEIVVRSHLGNVHLMSLPVKEYATTFDAWNTPVTTMTIEVVDQAELIGLLNRLHGVGLALLSLSYIVDQKT